MIYRWILNGGVNFICSINLMSYISINLKNFVI